MGTDDVEKEIRNATRYYWATLSDQEETQLESEATAGGRRSQVVGGSQMDGFAELIERSRASPRWSLWWEGSDFTDWSTSPIVLYHEQVKAGRT